MWHTYGFKVMLNDTLPKTTESTTVEETTRRRSDASIGLLFSFVSIGISLCVAAYYLLNRVGLGNVHLYEVAASVGVLAAIVLVPPTIATRGRMPQLSAKQGSTLLIASLLLGCWFAANVMGTKTHDPLALELRAIHQGGCDAFFHAALAENGTTYGVISTGLNGVPVFHYHAASHWLFGFLAKVMHISILNFYFIAYPIFIVPLFVRAFLGAAASVRSLFETQWTVEEVASPAFWLVVAVCLAGCFPPELRAICGLSFSSPYCSESQTVGLLFFFLTTKIAIKLWRTKPILLAGFLPLMLGVLTATKVVWMALAPALMGLLFLRLKPLRTVPAFLVMGAGAAAGYLVNKLSGAAQCQGALAFSPWDIFQYMPKGHPIEYVVFFFAPIWLLLGFSAVRFSMKDSRAIPAQVLTVMWIVFFALINVIELKGGAGTFFIDPVRWMALVCLLALWPLELIPQRKWLAIAAAALLVVNIADETGRAVYRGLRERHALTKANLATNDSVRFLYALEKLHALPRSERHRTLLFIPQSCDTFWMAAYDRYVPFSATALSGMALLDGLPPIDHSKEVFGFDEYTPRQPGSRQATDPDTLLKEAQALGFSRVLLADWREGQLVTGFYAAPNANKD